MKGVVLKNNGNLPRKLTGTFGEIEYSRASLIPADKQSAAILWKTEQKKSVFPLDCALGVDVLPFKISCQMMCAVAKEAVRARSYSDASTNISEKYHVKMSSVQIEKITDFIGALVFKSQTQEAEKAKDLLHQKVDGRRRSLAVYRRRHKRRQRPARAGEIRRCRQLLLRLAFAAASRFVLRAAQHR